MVTSSSVADDVDKDQVRCLYASDVASGPTDEHRVPEARHRCQPVPDQQQHACSIAAPPLRGQRLSMQTPSLRGNPAGKDPDPLSEQRLTREPGPRVPCATEATLNCPGQLTEKHTCPNPCQAGYLCRGSKPVSRNVEVPGTSLLSGRTGTTSPSSSIAHMAHHHGHLGSNLEPHLGSTTQLAVSDTRGPGPPVSDTRSLQRSEGVGTERVKRPVSDTPLLAIGASVSDTRWSDRGGHPVQ